MKSLANASVAHLEPSDLVESLGSKDWGTSQTAAVVLFQRGASALDALIEGLSHADWRIRKQCAALMDHLGDERCVGALWRALEDPIAGVRRLAIHALGCQPCKAAPLAVDIVGLLIERALFDSSLRVRRVAVHMLGLQTYDMRAVTTLHAILDREADAGLRSRARHALGEHERRARVCGAAACPAR